MTRASRVFVTVFAVFAGSVAVSGDTDLLQENEALRAQVAQLTARIAELESGMCAGAEGPNAPDGITLLRKLAEQQMQGVALALGQAAGPLIVPDAVLGATVPSEYIILLDGPPVANAAEAAAVIGVDEAQITHVYARALSGFSARLSAAQRQSAAQRDRVAAVVENGYVFASSVMTRAHRAAAQEHPTFVQSSGDAPDPVDVYLFDTGIRGAHRDLRGRVAPRGFSSFDNGIAGEDCSGHGTHVAARIAGHTLGVSDAARLVSVKVIDRFGTGDEATVIAGIDWVMGQTGAYKLVNMSLTRLVTQSPSALDIAVTALIDAGATVVVAAGNAASDASAYTPARIDGAITVGSAQRSALSDFSNAGIGVDLYAQGEAVASASIRDICGVAEMSGTSMAAPYVTGLIAQMLADGIAHTDLEARLRDRAMRVDTGAFAGETERFILLEEPRALPVLCGAPQVQGND